MLYMEATRMHFSLRSRELFSWKVCFWYYSRLQCSSARLLLRWEECSWSLWCPSRHFRGGARRRKLWAIFRSSGITIVFGIRFATPQKMEIETSSFIDNSNKTQVWTCVEQDLIRWRTNNCRQTESGLLPCRIFASEQRLKPPGGDSRLIWWFLRGLIPFHRVNV